MDAQIRFTHQYIYSATHVIYDGTRLVRYSKGARVGYNHNQTYDP